MQQSNAPSFDASYYATGCGAEYVRNDFWLAFFDGIAGRICTDIAPATVLDAGCAKGFLIEQLRRRQVEAWGIDISDYAIGQAHESIRAFCKVGSITEPFDRTYDLIVCIEVVEHMPPADAARAIANLCAHTDDILFSSSPDDFAEATHINVQPAEHWAEAFARQGFFHDLSFDASFITPWAARFCRRSEPAHRIVRDYERRLSMLQEENRQLREAAQANRNTGTTADLIRERDALRDLVARYERGRFMRFMRWLKGGR
jgi:hypothetical protein